jgi:hypothetical protein
MTYEATSSSKQYEMRFRQILKAILSRLIVGQLFQSSCCLLLSVFIENFMPESQYYE